MTPARCRCLEAIQRWKLVWFRPLKDEIEFKEGTDRFIRCAICKSQAMHMYFSLQRARNEVTSSLFTIPLADPTLERYHDAIYRFSRSEHWTRDTPLDWIQSSIRFGPENLLSQRSLAGKQRLKERIHAAWRNYWLPRSVLYTRLQHPGNTLGQLRPVLVDSLATI